MSFQESQHAAPCGLPVEDAGIPARLLGHFISLRLFLIGLNQWRTEERAMAMAPLSETFLVFA